MLGLLAGLVLLVLGAELVVRQGSALASRLGVHPIVVGLTIVSLGTSLPELAIGLSAASQGNAGLAVGNIVGTNLVNLLLIVGIAAALRPIDFEPRTLRVDLPMMVGAALLLLVLAADGALSTTDGGWMCAYGAAYLVVVVAMSRSAVRRPGALFPSAAAPEPTPPPAPAPSGTGSPYVVVEVVLLVVGLVVIIGGAELLVDAAVSIARDLGASDALIGLTVVAIGTSAPELVTTVVSTVRGDRAIAVGNLIGSSVFNIALILGPTVIAAPGDVRVPDEVLSVDLLLMVGAAVVCVPAFWTRRRLGRVEGLLYVAAYLAYLAWLVGTRL